MGDEEVISKPPLLDQLYEGDSYLKHHESDLLLRWNRMTKLESTIIASEGDLAEFAASYKNYGIVQKENGNVEVCCKRRARAG